LSCMNADGDGGYIGRRILIYRLNRTYDWREYIFNEHMAAQVFQPDASRKFAGMTTHEINNGRMIDGTTILFDVISDDPSTIGI
jgi:hypothetical protein